MRELSICGWNMAQAETQFQGEKMSHELACIMLSEAIQYACTINKEPVYALFLDARSAFDRVIREILVRNLYLAGTDDHRLIYLNHRLSNRETFCDYNKELMGPILDVRGLEQGGISSSDEYKLYNNEQVVFAQISGLGVTLGNRTLSCISLADDAVLLSSSITNLKNLLRLTVNYCKKYDVDLVPEKTKLLDFYPKRKDATYDRDTVSSVHLNGQEIAFSSEALHLGVLRSTESGNMPAILDRLAAHRKQLFSLLPTGMASHHHCNPAASLKVERVYCLPVLLSGLGTLILSKAEVNIITKYRKNILLRLMKIPPNTPDVAVYFLAGSLPAEALLHQKQLVLFNMICHLEENFLKLHAIDILLSGDAGNSWFHNIQLICYQYGLPNPLTLLNQPMTKTKFKSLTYEKIHEFWRRKLCQEAAIDSLKFMNCSFTSLTRPHVIFTSLDGNPYQAKAACIQASLLSGKYRTEKVKRFWSGNKEGFCLQKSCLNLNLIEDNCHFLLHCLALSEQRRRLAAQASNILASNPVFKPIFDAYLFCNDDNLRLQFLLDCSILPMVIQAYQLFGDYVHNFLFKMTRSWCRSLHRERAKLLGHYIG